ncbi:TIGR04211 family SH3 domain-containing protein [Psychromonas sp.]|nr:TIGR04211 family SH3 domain-containing protein [Psychromonas sp.]
MKSIKFLLCLLFSSTSFAATQYVSDDLSIFMHSGPSLEYRIIGSIQVGTAVTTLKYDEQTKFMQIKSPTGRTGWVKASEIQQQPPAKSLLPEVQKKLQISQEKLKTINDDNQKDLSDKEQAIIDKDDLIAQLENEKKALRDSITELEARNMELDLLQDTKDERVKMEWLMYGGSVLFFGMLVGLILPFIPRRKKRSDNW